MLTLQALMCIEGSDRTGGEPLHPGKVAKLDGIFQLNCKEVHTHASYKTTRTWENLNH